MAEQSFDPWVLEMLQESMQTRLDVCNAILEDLKKYPKEINDFLEVITDTKLCDLVGFSANVQYVPMKGEEIITEVWRKPFLHIAHKKLPCVFIIGDYTKSSVRVMKEPFKDTYDGPRERLKWVKTLLKTSPERRNTLVEVILDGLRSYRPKKSQLKKNYLSDELLNENNWKILGFAANVQYVRAFHDNDEMCQYIFIHPWGVAPLIVKHKRLPVFMIAGPSIRWNDSILGEIKNNTMYIKDIEGHTG